MISAPIFAFLPLWLVIFFVFTLGAIIGSFLDVVVTRFHAGASLSGRSRCLSCGRTLSWYELVPCLSFLILRGRCQGCHSLIPKRLLVTEIITGGLFTLVFFMSSSWTLLFLNWILVSILLIITLYDVMHLIIPNEFVLLLTMVAFAIWLIGGTQASLGTNFLYSAGTALAVFVFYGSLWLFSGGRWIGLGDAKLAAPLAFILTPLSAVSFVIFSFWLGAVISLSIMAWPIVIRFIISLFKAFFATITKVNDTRRGFFKTFHSRLVVEKYPRYFTIKSEVPFAPFIIGAFLLVYFFSADALELVNTVIYDLF